MLIEPPPPRSPNGLYPHQSFRPRRLRFSETRPKLADVLGALLVLLVIAACVLTAFAVLVGLLTLLFKCLSFLVRLLGG